ncbi:hypothetical protein E9840_05810 [Tissierella creatinini]|nr:hypothetical protein E9840_05810 [Tissierella creatinini]TJX60681.1 hypothetical protein E8P77_19805 [Soehngenia saccharolytica]
MENTLGHELERYYEKNRKLNRLKKDDYENLVLFFESYYGGKGIDEIEHEVLKTNLVNLLDPDGDFMDNIIEGIKSYPNDKSKLSLRLEMFLDHLNNRFKFEYDKNRFGNFKIKDRNERLLMMLKYLHSGERSRENIGEDFGISERTVANDLSILQNGFEFLGTEMSIQALERGTNKYRSLIHPVFLALNSAEIYSITIGLKLISKGTVFEESLGRIADVVYEQLSESSRNMIDEHEDETVYFGNDKMKFIDSRKMGQMYDSPYSYFLKEPIECIVTYDEDRERIKYRGKLKLSEPTQGNIYNKVKIETNEGLIVLDIDKILRIDRADKDEYFKDWL